MPPHRAPRTRTALLAALATLGLLLAWLAIRPAADLPVEQHDRQAAAVPALLLRTTPTVPTVVANPVPSSRRAPASSGVAPSAVMRAVAAARLGDAQAAHDAYRRLTDCSRGDGTSECAGLPRSLIEERLRFLAQAARAGIPAAQVDVYMEGPDPLVALDEQQLQAWRAETLSGLQQAAGRCDAFANGLLATLFDSGELAPRDAARAVAYAVAEASLRHRPLTDEALQDRLAQPLDAAGLAAAREQGLRLAASCR